MDYSIVSIYGSESEPETASFKLSYRGRYELKKLDFTIFESIGTIFVYFSLLL